MANEKVDMKTGPLERPRMPPANGFAKTFAPDGMRALGREGLMRTEGPGTLRKGFSVERAVMW